MQPTRTRPPTQGQLRRRLQAHTPTHPAASGSTQRGAVWERREVRDAHTHARTCTCTHARAHRRPSVHAHRFSRAHRCSRAHATARRGRADLGDEE
eukprot:881652-Rhodomonas_salina.1